MNDAWKNTVAVIGAGPIGLAAAAHLVAKGRTPVVFEAGASAGASMIEWSHVQVFSPWRYNVDPVAGDMLKAAGWKEPDGDVLPTGGEIVAEYLRPLAELPQIAPHVRYGTRVLAVARAGFDKMKNTIDGHGPSRISTGRDEAPFEVRVRAGARDESVLVRAVIDASGTYGMPNPLGANGLPAIGEAESRSRIFYGIPDVLGLHRARYAGKATLVVGSGHSAFNALLELAELASVAPGTTITWAVRRTDVAALYGGGAADALPRAAVSVRGCTTSSRRAAFAS